MSLPVYLKHNISFKDKYGKLDITIGPRQTNGKIVILIYLLISLYIYIYIGEGRVLWPMFLLPYKKQNISY